MAGSKKKIRRERMFVTGGVLLVLLVTGVFVTGRIINHRARQMSDRIVTQISESHRLLLQAELDRTVEAITTSSHFLLRCKEPSEA